MFRIQNHKGDDCLVELTPRIKVSLLSLDILVLSRNWVHQQRESSSFADLYSDTWKSLAEVSFRKDLYLDQSIGGGSWIMEDTSVGCRANKYMKEQQREENKIEKILERCVIC